ncbi:hypothetical protein C7B79_28475 [Chroococcidiopsis cubana CCALA 043]|nr:hypothetical protein [Chroococcidiopsis cubana]PSB59717.1 hypothetical protein C7B79_28475 [Chroococcidiopsis cubana CCALA 043]
MKWIFHHGRPTVDTQFPVLPFFLSKFIFRTGLMYFVLTPGERHDTVVFPALAKGGKVKRQGRGRPKHRSQYLVGDQAALST